MQWNFVSTTSRDKIALRVYFATKVLTTCPSYPLPFLTALLFVVFRNRKCWTCPCQWCTDCGPIHGLTQTRSHFLDPWTDSGSLLPRKSQILFLDEYFKYIPWRCKSMINFSIVLSKYITSRYMPLFCRLWVSAVFVPSPVKCLPSIYCDTVLFDVIIVAAWYAQTYRLFFVGHAVNEIDVLWQKIFRRRVVKRRRFCLIDRRRVAVHQDKDWWTLDQASPKSAKYWRV